MKRNATTSFSVLTSVVFLFILFLVFVLILTNQFLSDFLQNDGPMSSVVIGLSFLLIVIMLVSLCIQLFRFFQDFRANKPGIRFKLRLLLFFGAVVFLSSAPTVILTANLLRNAFDVWFARDTADALHSGVTIALRHNQDKEDSLRAFSNAELLPSLLRNAARDQDTTWDRINQLNQDIGAIQIFSEGRTSVVSLGNRDLWISAQELSGLSANLVTRDIRGETVTLRTLSEIEAAGEQQHVVISLRLPEGFDVAAGAMSRMERKLAEIRELPQSFPLLVFSIYALFFVPLVLIAIMISFYLADEVVRPLGQLEQAVRRVAQGDYSFRLIARRGDAMGHFVDSFNDMVGELERSRNDLKHSERLQTWQDIAQRMAHEIKNPLTPIKLSAERIRRRFEQKDPELEKIIEDGVGVIVQEVSSISNMLTEFRDFARMPQPIPEATDLSELVNNAWQIYQGQNRVRIDMHEVPAGILILVDREQLKQVFKNLFQNAIDAINGDGTIFVRAFTVNRMGQNVVRIHVRDTGPGLSADKLRTVFTPYYTTKPQGSGLGLAIVEKIVIDHGGRIWAESMEGQGASFFIDLPYGHSAPSTPEPYETGEIRVAERDIE